LCKDQNVTGYPTIKVFREGVYDARSWSVRKDTNAMLRELGFDVDDGDGSGSGDGVVSGEGRAGEHRKVVNGPPRKAGRDESSEKRNIARVVPFRTFDVHDAWSDAALSFEFALRNGIYVENGPLDDVRGKAFREWLVLLSRTLPPQMDRTRDIVDAILGDFARAAGGQSDLNYVVRERVGGMKMEEESSSTWRTCTYSDGRVGYTCGLWQLFHVMSLGFVEYNRHNPPMPTRYFSDTLRDYIEHFFQCEVCRLNFLSTYDACAFDGCRRLLDKPSLSENEWRELPLWLWETHNDVNVRLMGERLERHAEEGPYQWESQQARWPSLYACPNCWRDDRSWEEDEVFKFLRSCYWSGNPRYIKIPSSVDGRSRMIPLRWKLAAVVFVAVALILHMNNSKKRKRYSGRHKK
jgi:thiol oxidase